jgi:hypothetical protein
MATETITSVSTIIIDDTQPEWIMIEETDPEIVVCTINSTRWRD